MYKVRLKQINPTRSVSRIYRSLREGQSFVDATSKKKSTWYIKNSEFSAIDQVIFNSLSCDNSLSLQGVANKILESLNIRVSCSAISRKIKKIGFTRNKLTLVPAERNSAERKN